MLVQYKLSCFPFGGFVNTRLSGLSPLLLLSLISLSPDFVAQTGRVAPASAVTSPVPEMDRLARALVGDWTTTETMERTAFFPDGASRHGVVHARLAAAGTVLIYEVESNGSAGRLDGFLAIWWDSPVQLFHVFTCFNNPKNPCRMRGTAHWEGDTFVNDYHESADGKKTLWRDTFTFTPTSHTLVAAMDTGKGTMKTIITTRATRP